MRIFLFAAFAAAFVGCSSLNDSDTGNLALDTEEAYADRRAELIADLEAEIGRARASDVSACEALEVGTKACGGPAEFRVFSMTDGDTDRIRSLASDITALDKAAIEAFDLVSTCDVEIPPTPVLNGGRCEASMAP